jgi:hypothetical protein
MNGFEALWQAPLHSVVCEVRAGTLSGPSLGPVDSKGHVYVMRLVGSTLTTLTGRSTDVLYIGQGTKDRVHQLWNGQHSVCKRLAWAEWAHRGAPLRVRVEVRADERPELTEVALLNAFLWEHGQAPALNSKHEGWLPSRLLTAAARALPPVTFIDRPRNGPRGQAPSFTTVDLYGEPGDARWHWLGSLRWLWPKAWVTGEPPVSPWREGAFVFVTKQAKTPGWEPDGGGLWQRVVHTGSVRLGDPTEPGELPVLAELVDAMAAEAERWLPSEGVRG